MSSNPVNKDKILIVDDSPTYLAILDATLRDHYDCLKAANGTDALTIAINEQPSLILLDIMLPDIDGYEVCSRLKANPATESIPVVFSTSMDGEDEEEKGLNVGAVDYFTKPYSQAIVRARIKNHLLAKRDRDLLMSLACMDPLTGIFNRRRFEEVLDLEWRRAIRTESAFSLAMIDIDFFKDYNDTYGHHAGDDCLRSVAEELDNKIARPGDLVARYGGEEFVCVMPNTNAQGAITIAENFVAAIQELNIAHSASSVAPCVTISVGTATVDPATAAFKPLDVLKQADTALYQAKNDGRNRAISFAMTAPPPE